MFSIYNKGDDIMKISLEFPSPLGDYVFNLYSLMAYFSLIRSSFRPLSGIMFSIDFKRIMEGMEVSRFPSPLGDYVFNPLLELYQPQKHRQRFRPLSGIMFSIYT